MVKKIALNLAVLLIAAAIWLPFVHFFFKPDLSEYYSEKGVPPMARMLAARHLEIWTDSELRKLELEKMQIMNPEWDFMSRTYFVLALANMALRDLSYKPEALDIMDAIIENTLIIEEEKGFPHFLMGYGKMGGWVMEPAASQFVDGEIALMICARRLVEEKAAYRRVLSGLTEHMISRMKRSPVLNAESYPDECWMFCNSVSIAAIRIADILDKTNHSDFIDAWLKSAREKLTESSTGILISAFGVDGTPAACGFGPEGTTIWMVCNMLQPVDGAYAREQYNRAKKELARSFLWFGYAREWPEAVMGRPDVDSGPIVPFLEASAGSSGLALIGAASFKDADFLSQLITSLNLAGFPSVSDGKLRYMASNPTGDAVMLYALVQGPLWEEVESRKKDV